MHQLLHFYFGNASLTLGPSSLVPGLQSSMSLFLKCLALVHILMFPSPITRISLLVISTWQNPNNPSQSSSGEPWGALAGLLLFVLLLVTEPRCSVETPSPKAISKLLAGCCEMKAALISQSRVKFRVKTRANDISSFQFGKSSICSEGTLHEHRMGQNSTLPVSFLWKCIKKLPGDTQRRGHTARPPSGLNNMTRREMINGEPSMRQVVLGKEIKKVLPGCREEEDTRCVELGWKSPLAFR